MPKRSPPRRASTSAPRSRPCRRSLVWRSRSSPRAWPWRSAMSLRPCRSMQITAGAGPPARASAQASARPRANAPGFRAPVSRSCPAMKSACALSRRLRRARRGSHAPAPIQPSAMPVSDAAARDGFTRGPKARAATPRAQAAAPGPARRRAPASAIQRLPPEVSTWGSEGVCPRGCRYGGGPGPALPPATGRLGGTPGWRCRPHRPGPAA